VGSAPANALTRLTPGDAQGCVGLQLGRIEACDSAIVSQLVAGERLSVADVDPLDRVPPNFANSVLARRHDDHEERARREKINRR
jgi:hypothetical protein